MRFQLHYVALHRPNYKDVQCQSIKVFTCVPPYRYQNLMRIKFFNICIFIIFIVIIYVVLNKSGRGNYKAKGTKSKSRSPRAGLRSFPSWSPVSIVFAAKATQRCCAGVLVPVLHAVVFDGCVRVNE